MYFVYLAKIASILIWTTISKLWAAATAAQPNEELYAHSHTRSETRRAKEILKIEWQQNEQSRRLNEKQQKQQQQRQQQQREYMVRYLSCQPTYIEIQMDGYVRMHEPFKH